MAAHCELPSYTYYNCHRKPQENQLEDHYLQTFYAVRGFAQGGGQSKYGRQRATHYSHYIFDVFAFQFIIHAGKIQMYRGYFRQNIEKH